MTEWGARRVKRVEREEGQVFEGSGRDREASEGGIMQGMRVERSGVQVKVAKSEGSSSRKG